MSAEMERNAARTLRLRAFFRQFHPGEVPQSYYEYVCGRAAQPWTTHTQHQWDAAGREALELTLGIPADDDRLRSRIREATRADRPWVLIGGPPCQAYSLVGRARNQGIQAYRAEDDNRHYLYRHYLQIIREFSPAAFVMENVKGILSARVDGTHIFSRIVSDLRQPGGRKGKRYRILPLITSVDLGFAETPSPEAFVLRAETLGVPQARHRVVLFGLAEDIPIPSGVCLQNDCTSTTVRDAIAGLPTLRAGCTDSSFSRWRSYARDVFRSTADLILDEHPAVAKRLRSLARQVPHEDPGTGGLRVASAPASDPMPAHLGDWLLDPRLDVHLNHESRAHMTSDIMRYAFAAAYAAEHGRSPRGTNDFPSTLAPEHRNWDSGKFVDRFKVQVWDAPSSTITSHLCKDGHYFIHPDPAQIRSLTVREAARLQTFPDNYFFEGARGAQFRQVGNAVPPMLAHQIAGCVHAALTT